MPNDNDNQIQNVDLNGNDIELLSESDVLELYKDVIEMDNAIYVVKTCCSYLSETSFERCYI